MDNKALTIVNEAKSRGALIYVDMNSLTQKTELFKAEPTEIKFEKKQFHAMKGGKFTPDKAATDKIGELSGVTYIAQACTEELIHKNDSICGARNAWIARAQGKRLGSDGNWQESQIEASEFDPAIRAMDELGFSEITATNKAAFNRKFLELDKKSLAMAKTAVRLRVIRALVGLPASFDAAEIEKPMVFSRVVMNTAFVLSTPEGRTMATAKALGMDVSSLLYGKKPDAAQAITASTETTPTDADPENLRSANETETETEPAADTASLAAQAAGGKSADDQEFEELTVSLEALLESNKAVLDRETRTGNPYKLAKDELDSFAATVESRKAMTAKITKFLEILGATA